MSVSQETNQVPIIDFDKIDEGKDKFENAFEFQVEEDMINLGAWI